MKKWLKTMSAVLTLLLAFCLVGSINVRADEEKVYKMTAKYEGDDVPYGEEIDKRDFTVVIYYKDEDGHSDKRELSSSEFDISPDTMRSERSQRVTVSYGSFDVKVSVECAEPELEYIEADYRGKDLIVGGTIDKDDVRVEAFYSNGTSEYVDDWTFGSYNLREGSNEITIYYRENGIRESDEIIVNAFEGELSYISAYYYGGSVAVGGQVNTANIKVSGVYTERGYGNVTQTLRGWYLESYTIQEGNNTLTVVYKENGKKYTDTITVRGSSSVTTTVPAPNNTSGTWVQSGADWKYQLSNKTYLTNSWVQSSVTGKWYYVEANGIMAANKWLLVNGKWYYMNPDGAMATGWKMIDGKWYFLNEKDGDMYTGWKYYKEKWYYLTPGSGEMATNVWIGNWYVNSDGIWTQTK